MSPRKGFANNPTGICNPACRGALTPEGEWFARKLREAIAASGLSLNKFAKECGMSNAAISRWINGNRDPSLWAAVRIANFIGADLRELQRGL